MSVHRNIKLLSLFNFLIGFQLYSAVLIIYFAKVTGSYALGMSIFSIIFVSSALFEIPTGIFSDMIGRRKTVVLGAISFFFATIFYALGQSYLILVVGGILEGLGRSFFSGNNNALLYDTLAENQKADQYHQYLGKVSSTEQIALALGAVLGGFIANISLSLVMWLSVVPNISLVITSLGLVETRKHLNQSGNIYSHLKESLSLFRRNYRLKLLSITSATGFALGESGFQFGPIFINSLWPLWAVGIARSLSFVGGSISFYFAGPIIQKFKALNTLIINSVVCRVINLLALIFPTIASPAIMSSTSLAYGSSEVAKNTLLQKEFTNEQRATLGSINSLAGSILFGIVSFCLGLVADQIGSLKALIIINVLLVIPIFLLWKLFQHEKHSVFGQH
ncbi:MAG: MFS transporter [Patescibacteria group bacterium]|nr:MFS transporter [Patescibacteria group bacterium]